MSLAQQTRLLGEFEDGHVSIETSGRVIRPFLAPATKLVDEMRIHLSSDGIQVNVVDPANVAMAEIHAHPAAFESFSVDDGMMVGTNLNRLTDILEKARLGSSTDDPVHLDIDGGHIVAEIEREYANTTVRFADEMLTIDPDSLLEDPDIPDLDVPNTATLDVSAFADAVDHLDESMDAIAIRPARDGLRFSGHNDDDDDERSAVLFEHAIEGDFDEVMSVLSSDYLVDVAHGIEEAKVDEVTVRWGDHFPVFFDFERTKDEDTLYEGTAAIAPRIADD